MKLRPLAAATLLLLALGTVEEAAVGAAPVRDHSNHDHSSHDHGPRGGDAAPWHADPPPPGVDLSAATDTRSLYRRAGLPLELSRPSRAHRSDAAAVPPGAPVVPGLSEHVAPSCTGTGTDGRRVQVLYAHEVGTPSRFDEMLALFRHEIATVDDIFAVSSAKTGGGRRVRWVHDADCVPVIRPVSLPAGSLRADFGATMDALETAGFARADRKYVAFAEASQLCGIASYWLDDRPGASNWNNGGAVTYGRIDRDCWSTGSVSTLAHELTHSLGGVFATAPNATSNGHCDDEWDLMCYNDGSGIPMRTVCATTHKTLLDCRDDDYFNTAPPAGSFLATSWNTASSGFLDVVPVLGEDPAPDPEPTPDPDPAPDPAPGPVATDLRASIRHATATKVRAVLTDDDGTRLSGLQVELQRRLPSRTRWVSQATHTTNGVGRARQQVSDTRPATYRWVHRATSTTGRSLSNEVRVRR